MYCHIKDFTVCKYVCKGTNNTKILDVYMGKYEKIRGYNYSKDLGCRIFTLKYK